MDFRGRCQLSFINCLLVVLLAVLSETNFSQSNPTSQPESWCHKNSREFSHSFTWTISNYKSVVFHLGEPVSSFIFPIDGTDEYPSKWQLQLYPIGADQEDKTYVSLYLYLNSTEADDPRAVMATHKMSIIDSENQEGWRVEASRNPVWFEVGSRRGSDRFIGRFDLFDRRESLLPDDKLTIRCEVHEYGRPTDKSSGQEVCEAPGGQVKFLADFGHLLESGDMSDVTIEVAGQEFRAHKAILGARSPMFKAMFSNDMSENQRGRVQVDDIQPRAFEELIQYVYTGKCLLDNTNDVDDDDDEDQNYLALELLEAAERYQIEGLKAICEWVISNNLEIDSLVDVLLIAEFYRLQWLKDRIFEFIYLHGIEFTQSGGWNKLIKESPDLVAEVLARNWPANTSATS